jgi:hypothetical protein
MGQVLHRGATTTEAIRRAIQHSQESLRTLARRHGINPKTVAKWRKLAIGKARIALVRFSHRLDTVQRVVLDVPDLAIHLPSGHCSAGKGRSRSTGGRCGSLLE